MKKFLWILSSAMLLSLAIFSTGCEDDPVVNPTGPSVSKLTDPTPEAVVEGEGTFVTFSISAEKGSSALKAVTVYEGSSKVAIDDLEIDGVAASANPVLIASPSDVMTWEIGVAIRAAAGTSTIKVVVEDADGLTGEAEFDITVEEALEQTLTGVLFNQAGPQGTGGLDLDSGDGTGSSDATAELRDMGIDSLAGSGDNWRRRIGGINGATIHYAGNGAVEFGDIASKDAIEALYDSSPELQSASSYTGGNIQVWGDFKVTDIVQIGDVFVILKDDTYYLVEVTDVEENTVLGNNSDNYTLSIKY